LLRQGEISVADLGRQLPLSQSALSQHLAWLRGEHLVVSRREAQCVFYCLADHKVVRVIRLLNELYGENTNHV
ncbi:metalloregulator ArsR/SmtB family transcription factor, partial [Wenyingzhuangia sp. 1_MG-2023]|nr:metalloregulator ArsR/SmtB family transcription factor [Wenyingzhuangia sp. 1_MG-2023]